MRVVSGKAKGCKLFSLDGDNTRPTTDRVKEALFSIIQFNIYDSIVLDLFSGSGALGIEALSRDAKICDFVEQYKPACDIIDRNLKKTGMYERACIHNMTAQEYLKTCNKKYDIVLLDPPYNNGLCIWAIEEICKRNLISDDGIFVCETSASEPEFVYTSAKRKIYGKTSVTVINKEDML